MRAKPSWHLYLPDGTVLTARVVRRGPILEAAREYTCGVAITELKPDKPIYLVPHGGVPIPRIP